jgi:hypothetical protein
VAVTSVDLPLDAAIELALVPLVPVVLELPLLKVSSVGKKAVISLVITAGATALAVAPILKAYLAEANQGF